MDKSVQQLEPLEKYVDGCDDFGIYHTLDNTIRISIYIVSYIELGGILVQSMHIAADSG